MRGWNDEPSQISNAKIKTFDQLYISRGLNNRFETTSNCYKRRCVTIQINKIK